MEIELDLNEYCIETATKRRYERVVSDFFRGKMGKSAMEQTLTLLQNALTRLNFPSLRAAHRALAGKTSARIVLTENDENLPVIIIDGNPIDMAPHVRA